jgi:hypothetical protein
MPRRNGAADRGGRAQQRVSPAETIIAIAADTLRGYSGCVASRSEHCRWNRSRS